MLNPILMEGRLYSPELKYVLPTGLTIAAAPPSSWWEIWEAGMCIVELFQTCEIRSNPHCILGGRGLGDIKSILLGIEKIISGLLCCNEGSCVWGKANKSVCRLRCNGCVCVSEKCICGYSSWTPGSFCRYLAWEIQPAIKRLRE